MYVMQYSYVLAENNSYSLFVKFVHFNALIAGWPVDIPVLFQFFYNFL